MILRHALRYPESMVRLRGICLIHPAELRPKNGPRNDLVAARFYLINVSAKIGGTVRPIWLKLGGYFFGKALLVIRPGHFMSLTYRETKTLKPYM